MVWRPSQGDFRLIFTFFTSHSPNSLALDLILKCSCLSLNTIKDSIYMANYKLDKHYENITIQIYWKNFTTKKWKCSYKNSDFFFFFFFSYFCPKHGLWIPVRTAISEAVLMSTHNLFLSWNKKNNVYPCKPQFYYMKVEFKGVKII